MNKPIQSLFRLTCIFILLGAVTACNNPQGQSSPYSNYSTPDYYDPNDPYTAQDGYFDGNAYNQEPYNDNYNQGNPGPNTANRNSRTYDRGRVNDTDGIIGNHRGKNGADADQNNNRAESNNRTDSQEVADRLVKLATSVDQVKDATAVVLGRYAVVGLDLDAKLDRSKVGSIKYSVAEALKADPKGAYAVVTADPDITFRLREMGKEIREGRPVAGIMEELAGIVGRLMPQIPRTVEEPENPEGTPRSPEQQERKNR